VIEEEADRLSGYIENLLDATRLQPVDSRSSARMSNFRSGRKGGARFRTQQDKHTIAVHLPANLPIILADETRLNQGIFKPGLKRHQIFSRGTIDISADVKNDNLIFCISDEGRALTPTIFRLS
jgi:K+-sensing histidine kinase KdpD